VWVTVVATRYGEPKARAIDRTMERASDRISAARERGGERPSDAGRSAERIRLSDRRDRPARSSAGSLDLDVPEFMPRR
jgi:hypothetical protein